MEVLNASIVYFSINSIILLVLLACSALISGSEVAFFSLSGDYLEKSGKSKDKGRRRLSKMLEKPRLLLATILILNNLVNVAIVMLSTIIMWNSYGKSPTEFIVSIFTIAITVMLMFFGEVIPKVYANQNNKKFARFMAPTLQIFERILYPISWLLLASSAFVDKRFHKKGYDVSVDELNKALEITTKHEKTSEEEKEILKGIVNFGTLTVKQVMQSRMDVTAFDIDLDFHDLMDRINKSGYSRIPVFTDTIDKIEGILYIKDVLPHVDSDEKFNWKELLRPVFFVPETKKIDALLRDFQEKRVHMAIVVDEYGGTSGLITLEDIIEEIVGEINDEFDDENDNYRKVDNSTYMFEGKISLNDFCKVIDTDPIIFDTVKGESESLGGLILEIQSALPGTGEKIFFNKYTFTVMAVDNKRIKKVKVQINEAGLSKEPIKANTN